MRRSLARRRGGKWRREFRTPRGSGSCRGWRVCVFMGREKNMPLRNFGPFVSSGRAKTPLRGLLQLPCLFNPFDFRGCKRKRTSEYHLISYYLYCHIYATHPALSLVSIYTLLGPSVYLRLETAPVFKTQISPGVSKMGL